MLNCPLCKNTSTLLTGQFYECSVCGGIFRDPTFYLSPQKEKARYLKHNNDANDPGYQKFVLPLITAILQNFTATQTGLDFGAGTGSVIAKILSDQGYTIAQYDPFFHNFPKLLKPTYDYIACCEVIEHFHNPYKEFYLLQELLKPQGILYCRTEIYNDQINFEEWYYKNDPTHVFFYRAETLDWIKQHYNFKSLKIIDNLISLENK